MRSHQVHAPFNDGIATLVRQVRLTRGKVAMGAVYRLAMRKDASRLYDIRRRSILELAPPTMTVAEAQAWAARLTPSGMEMKLRELEIWVAERAGIVAGGGPFVATSWRDCTRRQNSPRKA